MKKIHTLLLCLVLSFFCLGHSLAEEETAYVPVSLNWMDAQWEVERLILEDYHKELYHLENPMVVVDPYGFSPLTALLLFESPGKAQVSVRVLGRDGGEDIAHDYGSNETFHQIPVVGLYADYDNVVEVTLYYADGMIERNYVTIPTGEVEAEGRPQWRDRQGDLRWVLNLGQDGDAQRISNGNILVLKENHQGFYELDLLGKFFGDYYSSNRVESPIVELPSGNFLLCTDHLYSTQDRLIELERNTGVIVHDLDLRSLFAPEVDHHGLEGDWFQLLHMVFDESDHSLWLYSRSHGARAISYPDGEMLDMAVPAFVAEEIPWIYPSFWEFELLGIKGKVMAKNQQDKLQTETSYMKSEGFAYDREVFGDISYVRNDNLQSLEVFGNFGENSFQEAYLVLIGEETYGLSLEQMEQHSYDVALSLDYETICENVSQGDYALGILLLTGEERLFLPSDYLYTVNRQRQYLESTDIFQIQGQISDDLASDFARGDFSMDAPMIVVNPYGHTPLSALVCFSTEETGTMEVFFENGQSQAFFAITDQHFLPIYGLYGDTVNQLTLQFTNERGERHSSNIQIVTEPLPQRVESAEVLRCLEMPEDFTFVSGRGLTAYDGSGTVRWYCDLVEESPILQLQNGNLLIYSDKIHRGGETVSSYYEIDLLGRVYHEYVVNGAHGSVQELRNGDLFIMSEVTSGGKATLSTMAKETSLDYLVVMDRETGVIHHEWDIGAILGQQRADVYDIDLGYGEYEEIASGLSDLAWAELYGNYDWFHNNAVHYDEETELITVSGEHLDVIFQFDGETGEVTWVMGDQDLFWDEARFLDTRTGFYGQTAFTYLEDGSLMVFDNGQYRGANDMDGNFHARIVAFSLDEEEMRGDEVFSYSYLPATGMGGIDVLGQNHYLFHFSKIEGSQGFETHIVDLNQGEEVFLLKISGESNYSARLPLYGEQAVHHNLFYETTRLGSGNETAYEARHLPLASDEVDFTVMVAVDQGDRLGLQISCHNLPHSSKYLVLDDGVSARCYPMNSETMVYINKGGIPEGDYVIGVYAHGDGVSAYTTSGYYAHFQEVEAFVPLAGADLDEGELYSPTEMVAGSLTVFSILVVVHQSIRLQKERNKKKSSR